MASSPRTWSLVALAATAVFALVTQADADRDLGTRIGKDAGSRYAIAGGSVDDPHALLVRVRTRPAQQVRVAYSVFCTARGVKEETNREFKGSAPLVRKLPLTKDDPDYCATNVTGDITSDPEARGRVTVEIFAK